VVLRADRLQTMDWQAIQTEAAAGRVQPWEILLHFSGMGLLEQLWAVQPALRDAEIQVQVDALIAKAQEVAQGTATPMPPTNAPAPNPMANLLRAVQA
jgi:hypothetical protein